MLVKAITNKDESYISSFIRNRDDEELSLLTNKQINDMIEILMELLDTSDRLDAIKTIYSLLGRDVTVVSKKLVECTEDFNKLVFLKSKIDYLKYKKNKV
ncbi:hypothetical protein A0H76_2929 [Hepatospora eriocheir]|uniref:Uncharacterized protein n=1 Tax=Hepatospora eriocheir TaxID=1081669 RepID=A0A1X0Q5J6_9MICR|nr:hypothetical protein A0H76_2929 [Hepatospora eriocheir]